VLEREEAEGGGERREEIGKLVGECERALRSREGSGGIERICQKGEEREDA